MFSRRLLRALASALFLPAVCALPACSTEAWYEGAKRSAESQCRQQPPGAFDACMERVNKSRYDTYEKERATVK